jgi:hypothetical protein
MIDRTADVIILNITDTLTTGTIDREDALLHVYDGLLLLQYSPDEGEIHSQPVGLQIPLYINSND